MVFTDDKVKKEESIRDGGNQRAGEKWVTVRRRRRRRNGGNGG